MCGSVASVQSVACVALVASVQSVACNILLKKKELSVMYGLNSKYVLLL